MAKATNLSPERKQQAHEKAERFRDEVTAKALEYDRQNFFIALFAIAAERIAQDADDFCARAEGIFEEIEAFGQEPQLDSNWLAEVTGEKDTFYFSIDSLVTEVDPLPRSARQQDAIALDEDAVVLAVEDAIQSAEDAIQSAEDAIAVAHAENSRDWIGRITAVLRDQAQDRAMSFALLLQDTQLSPIELWLGLLLGHEHWSMRQSCFYGEISVSLRASEKALSDSV